MIDVLKNRIGVVAYLAPTGPFNSEEDLKILRNTVQECIAEHDSDIVIDLANVSTISGSALEYMIDTQEHLTRKGGELKVLNANAILRDVFFITGFGNYVVVMDESKVK